MPIRRCSLNPHHIESVSDVEFDAAVVEHVLPATFPLELHVDHGAVVRVIEAVTAHKRPLRHAPVLLVVYEWYMYLTE